MAENTVGSTIGNILWFLLGGIVLGLTWFLLGIILCVTIIGIPFGLQCFKFSKVSFFPFGKEIKTDFSQHPIMNIIWMLLFGWELACSAFLCGIVLCITIIGIPFGKQYFKLGVTYLMPFGAEII